MTDWTALSPEEYEQECLKLVGTLPKQATYKWDGGYSHYESFNGQAVTVVRPLRALDEVDQEVGPMYEAQLGDGTTLSVYFDEIQETHS